MRMRSVPRMPWASMSYRASPQAAAIRQESSARFQWFESKDRQDSRTIMSASLAERPAQLTPTDVFRVEPVFCSKNVVNLDCAAAGTQARETTNPTSGDLRSRVGSRRHDE